MFKKICGGMRLVSILALVITAIVIFSASYFIFSKRIASDIRSDAYTVCEHLEAVSSDKPSFSEMLKDKAVFVLSSRGECLFMSDIPDLFGDDEKLTHLSSVRKAYTDGVGESERYADGILKKMYSVSVRLYDGRIVTVSAVSLDIASVMFEIGVVVLVLGLFVYILSALISKRLTENIIAPIENTSPDNIDEENFPYTEMLPFIRRISAQNAEIKRQIERVRRQKLRLQAVSESMNEGLVVLDREGNILSVNDSAVKYFGLSGNEKYTKTGIMSLTGGNTEFADNIIKALHNERGSFRYTTYERTFEVFYSPVTDEEKVLGVIILMFDITEKLANEQIRAEFTANVSHELKTPLTTIHGFAQLLSGGMAEKEDVAVFASKIEKESGRLITLVEDIIELSNLDEGAKGESGEFDIYSVVSEIAEGILINAEKRGITVSVTGEGFTVCGDRIRIYELIYNIVDNAVKYNNDGGRVDITVHDGCVSVKDTGIGIPAEYRERIFERFFRVDKSHSKKVNGTGLGLSIVKHIAKNNGIGIEVDSEIGKGTEFRIIFGR